MNDESKTFLIHHSSFIIHHLLRTAPDRGCTASSRWAAFPSCRTPARPAAAFADGAVAEQVQRIGVVGGLGRRRLAVLLGAGEGRVHHQLRRPREKAEPPRPGGGTVHSAADGPSSPAGAWAGPSHGRCSAASSGRAERAASSAGRPPARPSHRRRGDRRLLQCHRSQGGRLPRPPWRRSAWFLFHGSGPGEALRSSSSG